MIIKRFRDFETRPWRAWRSAHAKVLSDEGSAAISRKSNAEAWFAEAIVADKLKSCRAALKDFGADACPESGRWLHNRAENSHLPFRQIERAMLRFGRLQCLQKFASVRASVSNNVNTGRALSSRPFFEANRDAALTEWRCLYDGWTALW